TSFSRDWSSDVCSSDLQAEQRMSAIFDTARKLRAEPDALPELQAQLRDQLDALDQASDTEALARRADEAHSAYNALAKQLTQARSEERRVGKGDRPVRS